MLKTGDRTTDRQTHRGEYRVASATKNRICVDQRNPRSGQELFNATGTYISL